MRIQKDEYLQKLQSELGKIKAYTTSDFVKAQIPGKEFMSRDMSAMQGGLQAPPHLVVLAYTMYLRQPLALSKDLERIANLARMHMSDEEQLIDSSKVVRKVAICHGHSNMWKDVKDFIQDRLKLEWDEFNRIPVAGISNTARLSEMLEGATLALIILTAEDEQSDGKMHARMNVIHEAGLFQGRLGFARAIILLEEGCEEFSNIHGLGQFDFRNLTSKLLLKIYG